ncbi:2'-5' RNA ligase family protein [Archaeoglobus veneficus]|uniref:2'-5' RNA ligase family protein n=1 Tax=Archaeoglobus veneficus TaxID=58290 RepID=UPI000693984D|nr:2'-5' RNA ligase family protein [Archaeoglobus veneficus]
MNIFFWKKEDKYPYLVEIRPMLEKYRIKRKISEVVEYFKLRRWHRVPHITLVYNFKLKKDVDNFYLAKLIQHVASKFDIKKLKFYYDGFELKKGDNGYILAFRIEPSSELKKFRMSLYEAIKTHIKERPDVKKYNRKNDEFWFHATIGYRLSEREFTKLKNAVELLRDEYIPAYPLRIPLLKGGKITYEYDVLTGRILPRKLALSKKAYSEMVQAYRRKFNVEMTEKINDRSIWLISDTHFDHKNIIKYCGRPFVDVREMNQVLLRNWNNTVKNEDTVYFLGDASFGKHSRDALYWISKLNGRIVYIRGNHEKVRLGGSVKITKNK